MWLKIAAPVAATVVLNWLVERFVRVPKNLDSPRTRTYVSVSKSALRALIYLTAAYYVLQAFNVNLTPLFASAGVIGLVAGLGLRTFIEDFFTGMMILTQDTISVGDYVKIGDAEGDSLETVSLPDS